MGEGVGKGDKKAGEGVKAIVSLSTSARAIAKWRTGLRLSYFGQALRCLSPVFVLDKFISSDSARLHGTCTGRTPSENFTNGAYGWAQEVRPVSQPA